MTKEVGSLREEVSIFIPTHNRKHLLLRNLSWLFDSPFNVFIADSSDLEGNVREEISVLNSSRANPWIYYSHKPGQNYYKKILSALVKIPTKTVVCPDDDFILWQNIPYLYEVAEENGASTVCGRDLQYSNLNDCHTFKENSRYRKFCIRNQQSKLEHLVSGTNPFVCTIYQFYNVAKFLDIWRYLDTQKANMPGNKAFEILFRSACFIDGPVFFCDQILRIVGESEPLWSYDKSRAVREVGSLNFKEEFKLMQQRQLYGDYVTNHAKYISRHFGCTLDASVQIVEDVIIKPMFNAMVMKHSLLWDQSYKLSFSFKRSKDEIIRSSQMLTHVFGLSNPSHRIPRWADNLDDFFLKDRHQWDALLKFVTFIDSFSI